MSKPIIGPLISKPFAASESALHLQRRIRALEAEIEELRPDRSDAGNSRKAAPPVLRVGQTVPFGKNGTQWKVLKRANGKVLLLCCEPADMRQRNELQDVRQWLNNTYYENMFSVLQRFWIYHVPMSGRLFLLTRDEAERLLPARSDRVLKSSQGVEMSWWLESRGSEQWIVAADGSLENVFYEKSCALRPAMWVDEKAFQPGTTAD